MVHSLKKQFKKFQITDLLCIENCHVVSLSYLASKVNTDVLLIVTIEVRDEPSYEVVSQINAIMEVKQIFEADIKDTEMKLLLYYLIKTKLPSSNIEDPRVQLQTK